MCHGCEHRAPPTRWQPQYHHGRGIAKLGLVVLTPPPLDLPTATALRAFEAAARLESFRHAADELLVTPAAVAQHVKSVEAWAQQRLFERTARGVILNDAGLRARHALTDAFHSLGSAASLLRDGVTSLRIAALPAIAQLWVVPRLDEIQACVPDADISLHALDRQPDIRSEGFDMVVSYEGAHERADELLLVANPVVATSITNVADLARRRRLRDLAWDHHWHAWLGADADLVEETRTIDVTLFAMAVDAARRGTGVLVGRASLLAADLASGALVEPIDRRVPTDDALSIQLRDGIASSRLRSWAQESLAVLN